MQTTHPHTHVAPNATEQRAHRWLIIAATCGLIFGVLHHIDHALRGNHVGWPLTSEVNPFTYSLGLYLFVVPGLWLTARGRVGAGYWLAVAVAGLVTAGPTHIGPAAVEPLSDIYTPWAQPLYYCTIAPANRVAFFQDIYAPVASPVWAIGAVGILISMLVSVAMIIVVAVRVRQMTGHW